MKTAEKIYVLADAIRVAYLKHGNDSWVSIAKDVKEHFNASEQNAQLREDNVKLATAVKKLTEIAETNSESSLSALNTITQLRKENEELKAEKEKWRIRFQGTTFFDADLAKSQSEITRLTELLRRAKEFINDNLYVLDDNTENEHIEGAKELLSEIKNAIKPSKP